MPVPGGGAPRWQLALLLGAPLAIGLGYLYLRRRAAQTGAAQAGAQSASAASLSLDDERSPSQSESLDAALRYKVQGNKAFHASDFDAACALYERAIAACPADRPLELATFYQNRSACHEKRERWDLVRADCTEALRLNGRYVRAFLRRARAAEKSGDLAAALEDMTAACILEQFRERSTLVNTDRVLKALGRRRAREAAESRAPVAPSSRFVKAYLASFSNDPTAKCDAGGSGGGFARARAALTDDPLAAERACDEEVDGRGERAQEALLLRGTLRLLRGAQDEALKDLTDVIDNEANTGAIRANALVKRATLHLQAERSHEVATDFERALQLDPDNGDVHFHRAQAFMLAGELGEARTEFAEAARLSPNSAVALVQLKYAEYNAAKATGRNPDPQTSIRGFEEVLRRFPDCPEAFVLFAEVLSDLEEYERASEAFDKAIEKDPDNANTYVHKAILELKNSGDVDRAVSLISDAIRIDDKCLFAYETLGTIEVQRDNLKRAISLFEKAIPLTKTESEMTHIFSLRDAAEAQIKVAERWGINATPAM